MKQQNIFWLICSFLILTACAPKKPLTYDVESSKALNIAKAAKMDYGLKDVAVPKDTVADFRNTKTFGLAYGLAGYNSPTSGLSASGSAGMNLLAWALLPKSPSSRNSIIAWMPEEVGGQSKESALDKMADFIIEATEKAAQELEFSTKTFIAKNGTDKRGFAVSLTNNESKYCKVSSKPNSTVSDCKIVYKVRYPRKIENIAQYVGQGPSWYFDPVDRQYTSMLFDKKAGYEYNQLELLVKISEYLPNWTYIYLAPGYVNIEKGQKVNVPLIINRGEIHYFVKPIFRISY